MDPCLSEDEIVAFVSGRVERDRRAEIELHLDGCPACFAVVARSASRLLPADAAAPVSALAPTIEGALAARPLLPAQPRSLIGERIGNYVIEKLLGAGGMGAVYCAVQRDIGKRVAIKFLAEHLTHDASVVQRFFAEGRAVNLIQHENIVDIFDFGQSADGLVYCVMELLAGVSLERELVRSGPLSVARTLAIVCQVGDALKAAHERGILHRDIKPDNVFLVQKKDSADFVKVLDFGIAKLTGLSDGSASQTATGMVMGTPGYMSPEQATGEPVDARTDVYAMGVLLYRMLAGHLPFPGRSLHEILPKQLTGRPVPLRELRPDVPRALDELVHAMILRAPEQRPASMSEVLARLAPSDEQTPSLPLMLGSRTPVPMPVVSTTLSGSASEVTVAAPARRPRLPVKLGLLVATTAVGAASWLILRAAPAPPVIPAVVAPTARPRASPPPAPRFEVAIDSIPSGATIHDGALVLGKTPARLAFDHAHAVELQHPGFRTESVEVRRDRPQLLVRLTETKPLAKKHVVSAHPAASPAPAPDPPDAAPKVKGDVVREVPF